MPPILPSLFSLSKTETIINATFIGKGKKKKYIKTSKWIALSILKEGALVLKCWGIKKKKEVKRSQTIFSSDTVRGGAGGRLDTVDTDLV